MDMQQLLQQLMIRRGSDLHIAVGIPPMVRVDGSLVPLEFPPLTPDDSKSLCYSVLTEAQKHKFEEENELDMSFTARGLARFRVNLFMQRGSVGGALRVIPNRIFTIEELGLPPVIMKICEKPKGLVLVTGATGSGKSTTLAAMLGKINEERNSHIMTIEDPIEFLHNHKGCLVNQREVGSDTKGFKTALKYVLRQDADIVLVGEMRDLETIEAALMIAETGHLCFATLHTNSCAQTINRIIDVFPPHQQTQVRTQLSFVIEGVVSQTLIPKTPGPGRALGMEIMVPTAAIRNLIREDKPHQIYSQMQVGQEKYGMQTMNQSLCSLYKKRIISLDDAISRSSDQEELKTMISNASQRPTAVRPPTR
ncbi:MAG: type IV pilus twitching motility protein PilT [Desulfuromonadales bacterium]|nr:type IV pilus twitching motility protein PilT [Desulfuromonadales bacterium]